MVPPTAVASRLPVAGAGWSNHSDAAEAGRAAAGAAVGGLADAPPHVVVAFASSKYDQTALLQGIRSVTREVPLIGGSDAGEITSEGPARRSVVVVALHAPQGSFGIGSAGALDRDQRLAGQTAARAALLRHGGTKRTAFLMVSDGVVGGGQDVIRGAQEVLGTSFPIVGGSAGDDLRFKCAYQYCNEQVLTRSVVGLLIGGALRVGIGVHHGWLPIGQPRTATKSLRHTLHELDGSPAARVYEDYFGSELVAATRGQLLARMTVSYPLGMAVEGEEELLLRNVLRIERDGSLVCAGEIPQGSLIRLMIGTKDSAVAAARKAAEEAAGALQHVACVILFDSVARQRLFGRDAGEELAAVRAVVGPTAPVVGCYTYGEQAPLRSTVQVGRTYWHNETLVVLALGL